VVAKYEMALPNLLFMKEKSGAFGGSRGRTMVDEIVLHGTESGGTETQSLNYLSTPNADNHYTHYWIGRTNGLLYSIVPEEKVTFHAGNPWASDGEGPQRPVDRDRNLSDRSGHNAQGWRDARFYGLAIRHRLTAGLRHLQSAQDPAEHGRGAWQDQPDRSSRSPGLRLGPLSPEP
jgi:hypothetical protein